MSSAEPAGRGAHAVLAAYVVSRIGLLLFHAHTATDLKLYRAWVMQAAAGRIPFADFPIEYPPLAWYVMRLPGAIEQGRYYFEMRLIMGAADLLSFAALWWIVSVRRRSALTLVTGAYVGITVILEFVLFDRLDAVMLALVMLAMAAWLQSARDPRTGRWPLLALALAGLGASYKLMPIVLVPFMLVSVAATGGSAAPLPAARRSWLTIAGAAAAFAAVLVPWVPALASAGRGAFGFVGYHAGRGIEIGSVWATIMWVASPLAGRPEIVASSGSWELSGALARDLQLLSSVTLIAYLSAALISAVALWSRFDVRRAYLRSALVLAGLPLVLDVFSVQYLIWGLPLLLLVAVEKVAGSGRLRLTVCACLAIAALTTAVYPLGMRFVVPLNDGVMAIFAARNLLYLAVWGSLAAAPLTPAAPTAVRPPLA